MCCSKKFDGVGRKPNISGRHHTIATTSIKAVGPIQLCRPGIKCVGQQVSQKAIAKLGSNCKARKQVCRLGNKCVGQKVGA